jgi:uncharacterized protein YajQ (UPF0234 family)
MPENTFDIVSKIDLQEVSNAIQQAMKEVTTRFDLKDSKSSIALEGKDAIVLHSADEYKLKAVNDIRSRNWSSAGLPKGSLMPRLSWSQRHRCRRSRCSKELRLRRPVTS